MDLPLEPTMKFGVQTIHRRSEPGVGAWVPEPEDARELVEQIEGLGYDSLWVGDHIAFAIPILDPLLQIAQAAAFSKSLTFGTGIYLVPLRHPGPIAKQVSTLDHLTRGRLIFGVGVGGEFASDYAVSGVPLKERGARLTESLEVLAKLWSGETVSHTGRFFSFSDITMQPPPRQPGGPPVWCGGRSDAALERTGRMAHGWISYVVTPDMYRDALEKIARAVEGAKRDLASFGTGHLLFLRVDDDYDSAFDAANKALSTRYAMDFTHATKKYAAIGRPEDVAERLHTFYRAGLRHVVLDFVGPYEDRDRQIERFAKEVRPLLSGLA